jgi:hypothetical protein
MSRTDATLLAVLGVAGLGLLAVGAALGLWYCEYRRVREVQQVTRITQQVTALGEACVTSLADVTRAAVVLARNERPLSRHVADSLRERRWVTP